MLSPFVVLVSVRAFISHDECPTRVFTFVFWRLAMNVPASVGHLMYICACITKGNRLSILGALHRPSPPFFVFAV